MDTKQKTFRVQHPKYFVDKQLKFTLKAFERESDYVDFILFFGIAAYLSTLYLIFNRENKVKNA